MGEKKLTFKIHSEKKKILVNPVWVEAEVENASCPNCKQKMVIIYGHDKILYAFCFRCQKFYVGEEG